MELARLIRPVRAVGHCGAHFQLSSKIFKVRCDASRPRTLRRRFEFFCKATSSFQQDQDRQTNKCLLHLVEDLTLVDLVALQHLQTCRYIVKLQTSTWNSHRAQLEAHSTQLCTALCSFAWLSFAFVEKLCLLFLSHRGLNPQRLFNLRGGWAALGRRCRDEKKKPQEAHGSTWKHSKSISQLR